MRPSIFRRVWLRSHSKCGRFTLTPQRMRMIVEAFKDALELGLSKNEQIVVRLLPCFRTAATPHDTPEHSR